MAERPVSCEADPADVRAEVERAFDLTRPMAADQALHAAAHLLESRAVQVTHPRYLGLFNPSVRPVTVAADALLAAYNPQPTAYSHAPGAIEMERHVLRALAPFIGMPADAAMIFTNGGSEANLTAILAALAHRWPAWAEGGIAALPTRPAIYASEESHHSFVKIVRLAGLGSSALRLVPVDGRLALDPAALARAMAEGRAPGPDLGERGRAGRKPVRGAHVHHELPDHGRRPRCGCGRAGAGASASPFFERGMTEGFC